MAADRRDSLNGGGDVARIAVISPKGGVGKTTLVANLAAALAQAGHRVLAADLDPQNALLYHLAEDVRGFNGLAVASLGRRAWSTAVRPGPAGVDVLPFGRLHDRHLTLLQKRLLVAGDRVGDWLSVGLESARPDTTDIVLIDTPPGASALQDAAIATADLVIVVLLADAASMVSQPAMGQILAERQSAAPRRDAYLLNQFDAGRALARDVHARMHHKLGTALVPGTIAKSQDAEEALGRRQTVMQFAPQSAVAGDYRNLARWVSGQLPHTTATRAAAAHPSNQQTGSQSTSHRMPA